MSRLVLSTLVVASLSCLAGCGADSDEPSAQGFGDPANGPVQRNAWAPRMSALGNLTLRCLGTVNPNTYRGDKGLLERRFAECKAQDPLGVRPEALLQEIDSVLAVQFVGDDGPAAARYMAETWETWRKNFPRHIAECPEWSLKEEENSPSFEIIEHLPRAKVGTEVSAEEFNDEFAESFPIYAVKSSSCHTAACAVDHAMHCGNGFGSPFIQAGNPTEGTVKVDPLSWEDTRVWPPEENPYLNDDFYHGMSFWGPSPGVVYGAVARIGERCTVKSGVSHIVTSLKPVYCTGSPPSDGSPPPSWLCLSQCRL